MAELAALEIPLKLGTPETLDVLKKLAKVAERLEQMGRQNVCMNEAIGALIDEGLSDEEARKKALGWLQHAFR